MVLEYEHLRGVNKWVLVVGDEKDSGFWERYDLDGVLRGLRVCWWR